MNNLHWNQRTIRDWQTRTFGPGASPRRLAIRANEEMAELLVATDDMDRRKIAEEAADVLIVLYGLAEAVGFDLQHEVEKKMEINVTRQWAKGRSGTSRHIEPEEAAA